MKTKPTQSGSLELMETAFTLIRSAPARSWSLYASGTAPFLFLLLFFCTDMAYNTFASRHVAPLALLLVLAFALMKTSHAFFARDLLSQLSLQSSPSISLRAFLIEFRCQLSVQAFFFLALPLSLIIVLPFGWLLAFMEHYSLADKSSRPHTTLLGHCLKLAQEQPRENHLIIWLTSPVLFCLSMTASLFSFYLTLRINPALQADPELTFFIMSFFLSAACLILSPVCAMVACNLTLLIITLPSLLASLFGQDTLFNLSSHHIASPTFLLGLTVLVYLIVKPLNMAVYVLRHFLSSSRLTVMILKLPSAAISRKASPRFLHLSLIPNSRPFF
ncbi:MAG: hypothetical protein HC904_09055 [Blastochloris sp.]|nr:hypothetical protein [Blastochloris sp.]